MKGDDPDGATPLTHEERQGLLATWVATRSDLNLAEQENIDSGLTPLLRRRRPQEAVLDDMFLRRLHKRMFGGVWAWAGTYRLTERNIGVDPIRIAVDVRALLENAGYWLTPGVEWISPDEALCKVHHSLVATHPFPNGNGRASRAYTDVLALSVGRPLFSWGAGTNLQSATPDRDEYLSALRALDQDPDDPDFLRRLVRFARS